MKQYKICVIIPTRNRHETLKYSIQTVLTQKYENYEVIVFDNNSSIETKNVVLEFNNEKLKYYRSAEDLAMSDSWEKAVSYAEGEYLLIIGDDDGLLPNSLEYMNWLINETNYKVIRWDRVYYSWPNIKPETYANRLILTLNHSKKVIDSNSLILKVANYKADYTLLPMLYNSLIHVDLINEIKSKTGRIFNSPQPDIYSGYVFAFLVKKFLSIDSPLSINGGSEKSNGHSMFFNNAQNKITKDFTSLYSTNSQITFHKRFPFFVRSLPLFISEPFQQAKDRLFPDDTNLKLDYKLLIKNTVNNLRVFDLNEWDENIQLIRESISLNSNLNDWFESFIKNHYPRLYTSDNEKPFKVGIRKNSLLLNAADFNCKNVYDVAILCSKIYGAKESDELEIEPIQNLQNWTIKFFNGIRIGIKIQLKKSSKIRSLYNKLHKMIND